MTFGASGSGVDSFERLGDINITRSDADHVKSGDTEIGDVDVSGEGGGVVCSRWTFCCGRWACVCEHHGG